MKKLHSFLSVCALVILIIIVVEFHPSPGRHPVCDSVCEAIKYIEAGKDIPYDISFPLYMSRFSIEVVKMNDWTNNKKLL